MGCRNSKSTYKSNTPFLREPNNAKELVTVIHEDLNICAAVCTMQGWRGCQEDRAVALNNLEGATRYLLCGVFDGHSGSDCSTAVASLLFPTIIKSLNFEKGEIICAIKEGFLSMDNNLRASNFVDGTTAICAIVDEENIWVANCGDSRATLCRNGIVVALSIDHKPSQHEEAKRIRQAGGYVDLFDPSVPRVMAPNSGMAMATSRTLGDFHFKNDKSRSQVEQIVSPEPTVMKMKRHRTDQFVVLASDGVWDVMSNQEVCDFLMDEFADSIQSDADPSNLPQHFVGEASKKILGRCLARGSMDNCSIIIIDLRNGFAPTPPLPVNGESSDTENNESEIG
mmetsp:Transcript_17227/g.25528  ORF Transcript_17227/g.25528 Transcript_17227/m.25528 type:complete len:340 (+) Transcript_17227:193-1212(+)